ncbi:MAG: hypothetical protein U0804_01230 [Gemmataceae bacterium]
MTDRVISDAEQHLHENGRAPESAPKRRGRPPGSKNKKGPKEPGELTSFLPEAEQQFIPEAPPPAAYTGERFTVEASPAAVATSLDQKVEELLSRRDFLALGTKSRICVFVLQDVSGSEMPHEQAWVEGCRSIPEEIGKVLAARNQIDVVHALGDEGFRVLSVGPGKDFVFPAGQIPWGSGTNSKPWLEGIESTLRTYVAHLGRRGIQVREKVVLICSDFCFGDDYREPLARFMEWAKKDPLVTVIPAVFGDASLQTAAQFAAGGAEVVDLKKVSFANLFRVLSQSVVRVSQKNPEAGQLGREVTRAIS